MNQQKDQSSEIFYAFFSSIKPRPIKDASKQEEWQSHVYPHGEIQELAPKLWQVTGTLPSSTMVPREMVLYQLAEDNLLIHSAIALNEGEMEKLESLGKPKILIVPNRIHRFDAGVYKKRYAQLMVVCPAAAKPYVEQEVTVEGIAEEVLPSYGIVCHEPQGIRPQELVYELSLPKGKALIFTDILFNLNKSYFQQNLSAEKFLIQWLGTSAIGSSGFFGITGLGRQFFMKDRDAYRQWLESLADDIPEIEVISVAHGSPIVANCNSRLREAAARLR